MEKLESTKLIVHKTSGLLNFLGGSFSPEKVADMPFSEVIDCLNRNGGAIGITISKDQFIRGNKINHDYL